MEGKGKLRSSSFIGVYIRASYCDTATHRLRTDQNSLQFCSSRSTDTKNERVTRHFRGPIWGLGGAGGDLSDAIYFSQRGEGEGQGPLEPSVGPPLYMLISTNKS